MADAATHATIPPALNLSDIDTTVSDEPRIRDLRLAEVLGMVNRHAIRRLIKRHRGILETLGKMVSQQDAKLPAGGRPASSFFLTKRQALFLTAKADTPRAAIVTVEMVEVFDRFTAGRGGLTPPHDPAVAQSELERMTINFLRSAVEQVIAARLAGLRAELSAGLDRVIDEVMLRHLTSVAGPGGEGRR